MATENLKTMKEQLTSCVQGQLGDISKVDTHELGEVIDMIKDLAEAIYYCTITDSMEKRKKSPYLNSNGTADVWNLISGQKNLITFRGQVTKLN